MSERAYEQYKVNNPDKIPEVDLPFKMGFIAAMAEVGETVSQKDYDRLKSRYDSLEALMDKAAEAMGFARFFYCCEAKPGFSLNEQRGFSGILTGMYFDMLTREKELIAKVAELELQLQKKEIDNVVAD